jgi:hypothetical protein
MNALTTTNQEEAPSRRMFEPIFRDAVSGVAGVVIYDKGHNDNLGRYVIAKNMKLPDGQFRHTQTNRCQKPAALRYAKNFLTERAEKVGREYVPGDGANTIAFKPLPGQWEAA